MYRLYIYNCIGDRGPHCIYSLSQFLQTWALHSFKRILRWSPAFDNKSQPIFHAQCPTASFEHQPSYCGYIPKSSSTSVTMATLLAKSKLWCERERHLRAPFPLISPGGNWGDAALHGASFQNTFLSTYTSKSPRDLDEAWPKGQEK